MKSGFCVKLLSETLFKNKRQKKPIRGEWAFCFVGRRLESQFSRCFLIQNILSSYQRNFFHFFRAEA